MTVRAGLILTIGVGNDAAVREPFAFGGVSVQSVEPFNFGDPNNAKASMVEPFDFGTNVHVTVGEPFDFGHNVKASVVEPFDLGSSGGTRGSVGTLGSSTAAPLMGWRD
jgi:hypothetical protein